MKIVLATDGSDHSESAAKFLSKLRLTPEDEIIIIHAISWVPIMHEWGALFEDFKEIREEIVPRILDAAEDALQPCQAAITRVFAENYPDKAIIDTAKTSKADMIVMGARGVKGIVTHIVGSITKQVAEHSSIPALIVKTINNTPDSGFKILFATDGSERAVAACKDLHKLSFPEGSECTVLHVVSSAMADIPERFSLEIDGRMKNIVASSREWETKQADVILDSAVNELTGSFSSINREIRYGDAPEEILNVAHEIKANLIIVGTSGKRGLKGALGSVSRHILNHAECSVMIG